jgi:hypothetical protein
MSSSTSVVDTTKSTGSAAQGARHRCCLQNSVVDAAGPVGSTPQGASHRRRLKPRWWTLPDPLAAPPGGPPSTSSSKLGGGCCQTRRYHPPGGPPSMFSSTWVVDSVGPAGSVPKGACHRRHLQPRWWMLPDPPAAPPRGPAIDVLQQLVAIAGIHCQRLPGGH